jgi:hypothetical protein
VNCQRASKGFVRLQSRVLKRMPLPDDVVHAALSGQSDALAGKLPIQAELAFMR